MITDRLSNFVCAFSLLARDGKAERRQNQVCKCSKEQATYALLKRLRALIHTECELKSACTEKKFGIKNNYQRGNQGILTVEPSTVERESVQILTSSAGCPVCSSHRRAALNARSSAR